MESRLLFSLVSKTVFITVAVLLVSCTKDIDNVQGHIDEEGVDFVATLSDQQLALLEETGSPYGVSKQKDAWHDVISPSIPVSWGLFDDPRESDPVTRSVGIYGSYPAQYWTMLRVKLSHLSNEIKDAAIMAIDEIESTTNVRFYNSIEDEKYYEPYHIELPNIVVRMRPNEIEGSGSFGLVGGEQYINVPNDLSSKSDNEKIRFFLHAFCNAAGMFNEQQRKDRDNYVVINLSNVKDNCKSAFDKMGKNYVYFGNFDMYSITLAASKDYSKNGGNTITKKGGGQIAINYTLSAGDKYFLNNFYLPLIARTDTYLELDENTFYPDGTKLTDSERLDLQNRLNAQRGLYGTPPPENRSQLVEW
ncbi:MAG: M12 family metallopeptidase [Bacteroidota bacterium]|nr:M12 family metallopeptidase [Bacteroidota bacterium]